MGSFVRLSLAASLALALAPFAAQAQQVPTWFAPYVGQTREAGTFSGVGCLSFQPAGPDFCYTVEKFSFSIVNGVPSVHVDFAHGKAAKDTVPNYNGPWEKVPNAPDNIPVEADSVGVKFKFGNERHFSEIVLTPTGATGKLAFLSGGWKTYTYDLAEK